MTTKREIISQALEEIGLAEYEFDASPEELQSFLRRMDRMAAEWDGIGIRVGYNLGGGMEDDSGLHDTAVNCFAVNLGLRMAPSFGKTVSPETKVGAAQALNALMVSHRAMPEIPYPGRLPTGTGAKRMRSPGRDGVPGLNEGATEY